MEGEGGPGAGNRLLADSQPLAGLDFPSSGGGVGSALRKALVRNFIHFFAFFGSFSWVLLGAILQYNTIIIYKCSGYKRSEAQLNHHWRIGDSKQSFNPFSPLHSPEKLLNKFDNILNEDIMRGRHTPLVKQKSNQFQYLLEVDLKNRRMRTGK